MANKCKEALVLRYFVMAAQASYIYIGLDIISQIIVVLAGKIFLNHWDTAIEKDCLTKLEKLAVYYFVIAA